MIPGDAGPKNRFDAAALTEEQLAGQRLMVGFDGTALGPELARSIQEWKVAGIVLFSPNIRDPEQLRRLCADAQACAAEAGQPPLLVAIDQEGGTVARLPEPFTRFPGNPFLNEEGDAERFARVTARELSGAGVNMNLAPVLDLAPDDVDSVMARRSFGADPDRVARLGTAVIDGLQRRGVMAVAKHFPGIGRTTLDSHEVQPVLDAAPELLDATDWVPFRAALRAGVAGVMLSHIRYPRIDPDWPASLSRRIALDLLRSRLGFQGVVMTDDMDMKAVRGRYDMATIAERVAAAAVDLVLVCHQGPSIGEAFRHLLSGLRRSRRALEEGRRSARRVLHLKQRYL
jgi:beta-N-acetylhexosaminidase